LCRFSQAVDPGNEIRSELSSFCAFSLPLSFAKQTCGRDGTATGVRVTLFREILFLRKSSMIRTAKSSRQVATILGAVFLSTAFAPVCAWAADDPDEASPLTVTADFNRDGITDKAEVTLPDRDRSGPGILTVSLGQPGGAFKSVASYPVLGHAPRSLVVADFNKDGIPDLIVGDDDGSLRLFLGDGKGNMAPAGDIAHLGSVVSIAVADFNHDGIPDMAVSDWRGSSVTIFLGVGDGSFRREWSYPLRMPGTVAQLSAADFNGDGNPDLAVIYGDDGAYTFDVMVGNGKGAFTPAPELSVTKDPNAHCPA
jgi:hypothetical protein